MHRRVPSARCSATRLGLRGLAGRLVFPLWSVRRRSWGSTLRSFVPAPGGAAFLRRRAHVPFAPAAAPINFRRVDQVRPVGITMEPEKGRTRSAADERSTSGLHSRLRSAPVVIVFRGTRSCLGLCLLQGCGHVLVHPCGLDPAADQQPPARHLLDAAPIRSWASTILPNKDHVPALAVPRLARFTAALHRVATSNVVGPSASCGADALPSRSVRADRLGSLSEVLHRP